MALFSSIGIVGDVFIEGVEIALRYLKDCLRNHENHPENPNNPTQQILRNSRTGPERFAKNLGFF